MRWQRCEHHQCWRNVFHPVTLWVCRTSDSQRVPGRDYRADGVRLSIEVSLWRPEFAWGCRNCLFVVFCHARLDRVHTRWPSDVTPKRTANKIIAINRLDALLFACQISEFLNWCVIFYSISTVNFRIPHVIKWAKMYDLHVYWWERDTGTCGYGHPRVFPQVAVQSDG